MASNAPASNATSKGILPLSPPPSPSTMAHIHNHTLATHTEPPHDVLLVNDVQYQNAWRMDRALDVVLHALRPFATSKLVTWHTSLLNKTTEHGGAEVPLKVLPVCTQHDRKPGDTVAIKANKLLKCDLCSGRCHGSCPPPRHSRRPSMLQASCKDSTSTVTCVLCVHSSPTLPSTTGQQPVPGSVARHCPRLVEYCQRLYQSWTC